MASKRPGFERADTDVPLGNMDEKTFEYGSSSDKGESYDEKNAGNTNTYGTDIHHGDLTTYDVAAAENHFGEAMVVTTAKDLVTHVLHVEDDASLSPWTVRMWFLGMFACGLSGYLK